MSRENGFALVAAIMLILVGLMMAAAAYRQYSPVLLLEERDSSVPSDEPVAGPALAKGLDLLRNGVPPRDGWACAHVTVRSEKPTTGVLRFESQPAGVWKVAYEPGGSTLDRCPDVFPPPARGRR